MPRARPAQSKAAVKSYPNVDIVQGDVDDSQLITREASSADVVLGLLSGVFNQRFKAEDCSTCIQAPDMPRCTIQLGHGFWSECVEQDPHAQSE